MVENRETKPMDHNFQQAIVAGAKSVVNGKGRTFFVLMHRTATPSFRAGDEMPIIVDHIEIGRDSKCQVRFDESQRTVSRRHAAIRKEGNGWILYNLSEKNPTLINSRPVNIRWFLNSGDEIQLSMEGPKMTFIVPQNNSVAAIPLTKRLNLFRQQALRPYKTAIGLLGVLLLLSVAGFSVRLYQMNQRDAKSEEKARALETQVTEGKVIQAAQADSIRAIGTQSTATAKALKKEVSSLRGMLRKSMEQAAAAQAAAARAANNSAAMVVPQSAPTRDISGLEGLFPGVFFVRLERLTVTMDGETEDINNLSVTGTGFLLADGRFVTARHMVEPWHFFDSKEPNPAMILLNMFANNGGTVKAYLKAYSPDGSTLEFNSGDFNIDRSTDETISVVEPESKTQVYVKVAKLDGGTDWATAPAGRSGIIQSDPGLSERLPAGSTLYFLGYPFGLGATDPGNVKPLMGHCEVSTSGTANGSIVVSDRNFESGNSGGPVLYNEGGRFVAVGIVSIAVGNQTGMIVPISHAR